MSYQKAKLISPSVYGGFQMKSTDFDVSAAQGTVSGWINLNSFNAAYSGIAFQGSGRSWWGFGVNSSGLPSFFRLSWYPISAYSGTTAVNLGEWTHIAAVYDSGFTFYVNGQPAGTASGSIWGTFMTTTAFTSGGMPNTYNGNPYTIDGRWSNVQVWETNLSASEIETIYNNGTPLVGTQPQASNLRIWDDGTQEPYVETETLQGTALPFSPTYRINNSLATETTSEVLGWSGYQQDGNPEGFTVESNSIGEKLMLSCWFKWVATGNHTALPFVFTDGTNEGNVNIYWGGSGRYVQVNMGGSTLFTPNLSGIMDSEYGWQNLIVYIPNTSSFDAQDIEIYINNKEIVTGATSSTLSPITSIIGWNGSNVRAQGSFTVSNWAILNGVDNNISNRRLIFNSGSPGDISSLNPKMWYKLNNTDVSFATSGSKASAMSITDSSSNNINATGPYDYSSSNTPAIYTDSNGGVITSFRNLSYATGNITSFMGPAVTTTNGISDGMTTANLVNSDLTRSIPYSSYSLNFDATSSEKVDITGLPDFGGGNLTISFWIKSGVDASNAYVLSRAGFSFYIYQNGTSTSLRYRVQTSALNTIDGGTTLDNSWHHCVMTFDGSANEFKVFEDGNQVGSTVTTSGALASGTSTVYLASFAGGAPFKGGNFSNLAIWNTALTENQILTIYNGGVPNSLSSLSPVGWWSLAGDSYFNGNDWICPDLGSGGNNGTSTNMSGTELVGSGPGSTANGLGTSMNIPANLKGNAPNSNSNAFSVNMNSADRVSGSGNVPG